MEHGFINKNSSSRIGNVCHKSSYYGRKLSIKFDLRHSEVTNIFDERW